MNDILGMLDTLDAFVATASRVPFSDKVLIEPHRIRDLIYKIRDTIISYQQEAPLPQSFSDSVENPVSGEAITTIEQAKKIEKGAKEYAQQVLASLQLVLSKMKKDLIKLEKNIDSGRTLLEKDFYER